MMLQELIRAHKIGSDYLALANAVVKMQRSYKDCARHAK
jgi:hypothetical protein